MGQRKCCVSECKSSSQLPDCTDVKFHAFPTNETVRNIWLKNCHIEQNRSITKSNVVCSRHFLETDYQAPKNGRKLLGPNSVPTIFAWGNQKTFAEHLADAQETSPTLETSIKEGSDKTTKTPSETTPVSKAVDKPKKMVSRSQANSAAEKQRSASAEEQTTNDANSKVNKVRKSLESATPNKSTGKEVIKSPTKRFDIAVNLAQGAKVEVQDLGGSWHNASVLEVDQGEQEVLISFEKNVKSKGPTTFKLNDEWIPMDSSRLRVPVEKSPILFKPGDRCLARWTDSRKFPATVVAQLENSNKYEVLFDDGLRKHVKGIHMSKEKPSANSKAPHSITDSPVPPLIPILPTQAIIKKSFKVNPIPKFDLSKFNLPEIPEGEWCCPWVNDTPIGDEGFLLNTDGTKRPTVLVQDNRLPNGWTKHLYQRSSTSLKWDVVLVGPNNKRFRSKNDVKVYLEEISHSYNPDIYDFSIHKRRAKDIGVYVYTDDYVPPVVPKPSTDLKLDSSLDVSFQDFKQEPFTGFSPNESTSSILSKIAQELNSETGTPIKIEPNTSAADGSGEGFTYVGALKVQMIDNLFRCPKDGCNKNFRKENHLQIHVKHYHRELSEQLGACPNMTELAYFRTMGTSIEESSPKNQIPNAQFFEKTYQSEMRTFRKSLSPTHPKVEIKTEEQAAHLTPDVGESTNDLKRKLGPSQISPEVKEKRKPTANDKVAPPEVTSDIGAMGSVVLDENETGTIASTPVKKTETAVCADSKPAATQKAAIPRFKIGHTVKLKANKVSRRKGKTFKKKFKKIGKGFKRKTFGIVGNRVPFESGATAMQRPAGSPNFAPVLGQISRPNRLKFIQYSSTDSNSENSLVDPNFQQRSGSQYIDENGEVIKIVQMRQEEIINCMCSYGEEDGLMIQCELCLCWQHGGCNGIEKESEVPEKYVCYICRNPQRARESMKYIHDQEWLYEGKLFHANYHAPSRQIALRSDILKQSHTLSGNLLELKRSLHSLNVKINIAANKDHPKMYLWSKKWEQSPPRTIDTIADTTKVNPKPTPQQVQNASVTDNKIEIDTTNPEIIDVQKSRQNNAPKDGEAENVNAPSNESKTARKNSSTDSGEKPIEKPDKFEAKEANATHPAATLIGSPKKIAKPTPNIPEPEAAIDSLECQHRLLEHIQKEQNTILSRMQTIDAQIMALESMDDHPSTNSKEDFAKTSQSIRMLLSDLAKMQKIAAINEQSMHYNSI